MKNLFSKRFTFSFFFLPVFTVAFSTPLAAQGDLLIFPKRIVFDGSRHYQDLSLSNTGADSARYVISVKQIRMKDDGSFESISEPDPGQYFADKNFRIFPRSVLLAPYETQTVKVQVIRYSQLEAGEYRSHLYFRAEKAPDPLGEEKEKPDSPSISIKLTPVFGISIPVIIRAGEGSLKMKLSGIALHKENDQPFLEFTLNREGNISAYGDISVDYISGEGSAIRIALVKGASVYTPNLHRHFSIPLKLAPNVDLDRGSLHIVFSDASGKTTKVAQEQFFLN